MGRLEIDLFGTAHVKVDQTCKNDCWYVFASDCTLQVKWNCSNFPGKMQFGKMGKMTWKKDVFFVYGHFISMNALQILTPQILETDQPRMFSVVDLN